MKKHPLIYGLILIFALGIVLVICLNGLLPLSKGSKPFKHSEKVGIIDIQGVISSSREIVEELDEFGKNPNIKAVIIRIDSPGGGVAASQEIYSAVKDLRQTKKIVASLGSVAASGGYLVACAAHKIVANPGSITGSISAVMYFVEAEELMKKIGLKSSVIKSGKFKDIGSPTRAMTGEEQELLQSLVDDIKQQFIDVVAENRGITREQVEGLADGQVFTGRQAVKLKLVDDLGDQAYAVRLAGKMASIEGQPEVVYPTKKGQSIWQLILQNTVSSFVGRVSEKLDILPSGMHLLYEYGK